MLQRSGAPADVVDRQCHWINVRVVLLFARVSTIPKFQTTNELDEAKGFINLRNAQQTLHLEVAGIEAAKSPDDNNIMNDEDDTMSQPPWYTRKMV